MCNARASWWLPAARLLPAAELDSPLISISFRIPFGVAFSGPPKLFTADTNRPCSSGVQRSRDF